MLQGANDEGQVLGYLKHLLPCPCLYVIFRSICPPCLMGNPLVLQNRAPD